MILWLFLTIYLGVGIGIVAMFTLGLELVGDHPILDAAVDNLRQAWIDLDQTPGTLWLGLCLTILLLWPVLIGAMGRL